MLFRHLVHHVLRLQFPFPLGDVKVAQQLLLKVAQAGRLLEILVLDHLVLRLFDLLHFPFEVDDLLGDVNVRQVDPCTRFVENVNGLVREETVGDVPVAQADGSIDGLVAVADTVMLFILVLDVRQDLDRFIDGGRIHHDLLEPAVERTVLFDVLAVFVQRCGSDALELPARERRLKHVRRIEGTRRSPRADDGMQLVNEEDDVSGFLQFVHDRFHPLLELPTVFCACNEGGQVKGDDPFAVQDAAHLLLDDAHREPLGNRSFPHSRFADEDRIVLLPAAEDLGNPFDLLLASDDRVQLVFCRKFGQVVTEIVKDGGLGLLRLLFRRRLVVLGRRWLAADNVVQLPPDHVVVDVELVEDLCSDVVIVPQEGKEQMFRSDNIRFVQFRFKVRDLEDLLGLLRQRDVPYGQGSPRRADGILNRLYQLVEVHPQVS